MNELIKIEKATCDGELVWYRIIINSCSVNAHPIGLVFKDQKTFPGIRSGIDFIAPIGKEIKYEEKKLLMKMCIADE